VLDFLMAAAFEDGEEATEVAVDVGLRTSRTERKPLRLLST